MNEQLEDYLKINDLLNEISTHEKELSRLKQELEKRRVLLEKCTTFPLNEILPLIKTLINKITGCQYNIQIGKVKYEHGYIFKYYLSKFKNKIDCDSDLFYDGLSNGNIILIGHIKSKVAPIYLSLSSKKKEVLQLNQGMGSEYLSYILVFLNNISLSKFLELKDKSNRDILEETVSFFVSETQKEIRLNK